MRSRSLFHCHFPCDLFSSPFQFALRFQVFDDFLSSAPLQFLLPTTFIAANVHRCGLILCNLPQSQNCLTATFRDYVLFWLRADYSSSNQLNMPQNLRLKEMSKRLFLLWRCTGAVLSFANCRQVNITWLHLSACYRIPLQIFKTASKLIMIAMSKRR